MSLADVRSVPIGLPESIVALSNGALDAAVLGEPYATEALKRQIVVMQREDSAEGIGDLGTVVIFGQDFMSKRHDVAVRVTKALIRAAADLQGEKAKSDENVKILSDALKLPLATVRDMAFPIFEPHLSPLPFVASLNRQAAVHKKNKRITAAVAAFEPSLVDGSFVAEATKCRPRHTFFSGDDDLGVSSVGLVDAPLSRDPSRWAKRLRRFMAQGQTRPIAVSTRVDF